MSNIVDLKARIEARKKQQEQDNTNVDLRITGSPSSFTMFPEPTPDQYESFVKVIRYLHQFYDVTEISAFDYEMTIKVREYTDYYGEEDEPVKGGRIVEFTTELDIDRNISADVCAANVAEAFDHLIDEFEDYEQSTDK